MIIVRPEPIILE